MATTNNETVGYIACGDCGERGSLHMTKRGKGRLLYKRCGCGCDQRTGVKVQEKWRREMEPLNGFEDMKLEPLEPDGIKVPEPKREPEKEPNEQPKEAGNAGVLGLLVLGVVSTVVVIAKAARGGA